MIEAIKRVNDGTIGNTYLARALCYKWRPSIGHAKPEAVPTGVNYDLWTGPAPMKPLHSQSISLQLALDLGCRQW